MVFAKRIQLGVLLCFGCLGQTSVADEPLAGAHDHAGPLKIPSVVRYRKLPARLLLLRSEVAGTEVAEVLPDSYIQLFTRLLDGEYDNELHRDAAQSLERVGRLKLAKPESYVQSLRNRLKTTDSRIVARACAIALAAADHPESAEDLAAVCQPNNEVVCTHVEPKLAEWDSRLLLETWKARISHPDSFSNQLVILACRCLAKVNDTASTATLLAITKNELVQFPVRQAAAEAAGQLDSAKAVRLAKTMASGELQQRLLAVRLLHNTTSPDGLSQLADLCDASENAIAAIAWNSLEQLDNTLLTPKLEQSITHADPNVRKVAVRVLKDIPSEQHNKWLNELLRDSHIEVRNFARAALHDVATEMPTLRPQIIESAGRNIADSLSNWQQIEQSLILLGQQRHPDFQADCIPLLTHPRNEVMVSAAWLLHVMPREELAEEIVAITYQQFEIVKKNYQEWSFTKPARLEALSLEVKFLLHVAGFQRKKEIRNLADEMFSKSAPTLPETRAVGLWALGMALADTPDEALQKKWAARLHDDSPMAPEWDAVKAASALSLGLQGMESSVAILESAHEKYGVESEFGMAVSTSLRMFGREPPAPAEPEPKIIGNWPVSPLSNEE